MTGSGPKLGLLLLLAVLLQTLVVTFTVLHFTAALNSVRTGTARDSANLFYASWRSERASCGCA